MEFSSNLSAIHTGTGSPLPGSAIPGVRHSHGPGIGVRVRVRVMVRVRVKVRVKVRVRVRRTVGMADPGNGGPESSIRSGAHKLFRRFLDFSQFLTSISRKLWRQLATKMRTM